MTRSTNNAIPWHNTIYNGIDSKVFEQIKDVEKASEVWVRLEEHI
jgi:hypothetical protein